jgi:hypothetical protein
VGAVRRLAPRVLRARVLDARQPATWHTELAPRGYAKSTIVGVATILAVLGLSGLALEGKLPYPFKPRHYCWLVQDTGLQAAQSMQSIITECEDNARVKRWFPHLRPARDAKNMPIADRDDDVVFELGLRLQALGAGQKLRGRRHRQFRPDFALIDDLENDETVLTKYQRDKLDKWLSSAFAFALAKGADVHYVGTLLHNDAVLARVRKRGGWRNHRYDAFRRGRDDAVPRARLARQRRRPDRAGHRRRGRRPLRPLPRQARGAVPTWSTATRTGTRGAEAVGRTPTRARCCTSSPTRTASGSRAPGSLRDRRLEPKVESTPTRTASDEEDARRRVRGSLSTRTPREAGERPVRDRRRDEARGRAPFHVDRAIGGHVAARSCAS